MQVFAPEELIAFFSKYKKYHYKRREMILRADDIPSGVYCIAKGYIRIYALSREGQELTLLILKPYDFFPGRWAVTGAPITYYFEALTDAELWRAPKKDLLEFLKGNNDVLFAFTRRMLIRLGGMFQRIEYLAFGDAYEKIASVMTILADRFGREENGAIVIEVPLTHKDIATLLGISRETASVEMERLMKKNILSYKKHIITIYDLDLLKKESSLQ